MSKQFSAFSGWWPVSTDQYARFGAWFALLVVFVTTLLWLMTDVVQTAEAHGTMITYATTLTVQGAFESGEPMANAEVSIYTPADPETAWQQGIADADGRYTFAPDTDFVGEWTVSYRSAGHGDIAYIPVGAGITSNDAGGLTGNLQRIVMAIAVIWGFVGTALYFQARQSK